MNLTQHTMDATETIRNAILAKPDGILEHLAEEHGVSLRAVIDCLPDDSATAETCARFVDVLSDVADWGDITFVCHSKDAVVEFCGLFPTGRMGLWPLAPVVRARDADRIRWLDGFNRSRPHLALNGRTAFAEVNNLMRTHT